MSGQDLFVQKKPRGRPKGRVRPPTIALRLPLSAIEGVDVWIARQPDPKPRRSEAIGRLVEKGLASEGVTISGATLARQISDQETTIAEMPEPRRPSPEAGMAAMDKALAENDLVDMKNKRTRRKNAKRK